MFKRLMATLLLVSLAFSGGLSTFPALSAPQTSWLFEGRVYAGQVGDISHPLVNVTVSVYGATADWPETGTLIRSTSTDGAGWYGITIFDDDMGAYDYLYIEETDPAGYQSVDATTVDGIVRSPNRIDYEQPLDEKTTSGNKFWDEIPVLSGRVYEGVVDDESTPLPGVLMELYASNNVGDQGSLLVTTTTDTSGWYGLDATLGYERYTIVEVSPAGYNSEWANTVDGTVLDPDRIRYDIPLSGQTLTGNKFWDTPVGGALPDLIVTDIWVNGGEICYQVANIGTAVAAPGHETVLEIDSGWVETKVVTAELAPDQPFEDCFAAVYACSAPEDIIEVTTDAGAVVPESEEANNTRVVTLACDAMPPDIIDGPFAIGITPISAVIYWVTTESASSDVHYGTSARTFNGEKLDATPVVAHEVLLEDLLPFTTYRYKVHSADTSDNAVESGVHTFRTHAEPDVVDPFVEFPDPGEITGTVTITATASDNAGVDRVQFLIDGEVVFTDYSVPYVMVMDSLAYANGDYNVQARAFDTAGNAWDTTGRVVGVGNLVDTGTPTVNITYPANDAVLASKVNVTAALSDDAGLAQVFFKISQGTTVWTEGFEGLPAHPTSYNASFEWDTTGVANGSYRVAIETYDTQGKYGYDFRDITVNQAVAPKPAKLKVLEHTATRSGNGFVVSLKVKNIGDETASNIAIEDTLKAFQPISRSTFIAPAADYVVDYDPYHQESEVQITAAAGIPGGQSATFTYHAAPVLYYPTSPVPAIGHSVYLHWDPPSGSRMHDIVAVPIVKTQDGDTLAVAHGKAVKTADYIVMTNPSRLFAFGFPDTEGVYGVLSEMAQLAVYQQGVLGYLNTYDRGKIDGLLAPKGAWAKMLSAQFSQAMKGYVLIVGEREIVPTSFWGGFSIGWSNSSCTTTQVQDSDLSYANTSGDNAPELIVGRAIGNDPADLYNVLHTSNAVFANELGYSFDRSDALLVSGTDGNSKMQNEFINNVNAIEKTIKSDFTVAKIHWSDYASNTARNSAFSGSTSGKDVVVYSGHGGPDGWGSFDTSFFGGVPGATPSIPAVDFNGSNPLVAAFSCLTGSYEDHTANTCSYDGGDYNIAEAFLDAGAGVYIGSTEVSASTSNSQAGKEFFSTRWSAHTTTIGSAFTALKRAHYASGGRYWRLWVIEYNLYGDPKYGALPSPITTAVLTPGPAAAPAPTIDVTVPDYTVTTLDNIDYVEIPGGDLLGEAGMPQVPMHVTMVDYPAGYRVQNVFLTARSGVTTEFGLNLPIHENTIDLGEAEHTVQAFRSAEDAWYPEADYEWTLLENPDGSTTLVLMIYPFAYNGATTESTFYSEYSFAVEYAESNAHITELTVDKSAYNYGETVNATLSISATGEIGDTAVGCVIKHAGTGEVVIELMMETLTELEGQVSFTPSWVADFIPQDYYGIECTLSNPGSVVLDREMQMLNVGTTRGVITDFTVAPGIFMSGEVVTASLTLHNSGTVDLNGTLVVDVRDSEGVLVDSLSQMYTGLTPAQSASFEAEWHTPPDAFGPYYLTGYALYNSLVTDPEHQMASTPRVLLPMLLR